MMNILYLGYNILDLLIFRGYLGGVFGEKRITTRKTNICIYFVYILVVTWINSIENPNYNLIISCLCMYLYSCTFEKFAYKHILPLVLYVGLGFVAEPIGFLLTKHFIRYQFSFGFSYAISAGLSLMVRFLTVNIICRYHKINSKNITLNIAVYLCLIVIMGIFECCIAIWMAYYLGSTVVDVLCVIIVITVLLINMLEFALLEKYQYLIEKGHLSDMLLQEADAKEVYYHEIEMSNHEIRKIRHDLKNRLLGVSSVNNIDLIKKEIRTIIDGLEMTETNIYTSNVVFNTILNTKIHLANKHSITTEVSILLPRKINMEYGDAGILLGNLLDNAIEACMKLPVERRHINITISYQNKMMIMKIVNSKNRNQTQERHKKYNRNHGFGLKSVKAIIDKYDGTMDIKDCTDVFEVDAVIYGLKDDDDMCVHG